MILKGNLIQENSEYVLRNKLGNFSFSTYIDLIMLTDIVRVKITDNHTNTVVFDKRGMLHKKSMYEKTKYEYLLGDYNLEDTLYGITTKYDNNITIDFDSLGDASDKDWEQYVGGSAK